VTGSWTTTLRTDPITWFITLGSSPWFTFPTRPTGTFVRTDHTVGLLLHTHTPHTHTHRIYTHGPQPHHYLQDSSPTTTPSPHTHHTHTHTGDTHYTYSYLHTHYPHSTQVPHTGGPHRTPPVDFPLSLWFLCVSQPPPETVMAPVRFLPPHPHGWTALPRQRTPLPGLGSPPTHLQDCNASCGFHTHHTHPGLHRTPVYSPPHTVDHTWTPPGHHHTTLVLPTGSQPFPDNSPFQLWDSRTQLDPRFPFPTSYTPGFPVTGPRQTALPHTGLGANWFPCSPLDVQPLPSHTGHCGSPDVGRTGSPDVAHSGPYIG